MSENSIKYHEDSNTFIVGKKSYFEKISTLMETS